MRPLVADTPHRRLVPAGEVPRGDAGSMIISEFEGKRPLLSAGFLVV
jgi:hypothetical protein